MNIQYFYRMNEDGTEVYDKPSDPFGYKELAIVRPGFGMVLHNTVYDLIRNGPIQIYSACLSEWEEIPGQL